MPLHSDGEGRREEEEEKRKEENIYLVRESACSSVLSRAEICRERVGFQRFDDALCLAGSCDGVKTEG